MTPDPRPGVAIVVNSLPPYRLHVHRRVAREMPEIKLWTVFTHEGDARWPLVAPDEIGPVSFGPGESVDRQGALPLAPHEWRKGGRVIDWLRRNDIRAVVLLGYNDAGRVRLLRWCRANGVPCFVWGDSNIRGDRARGLKAVVKRAVVGRLMGWSAGALACGTLGEAYFQKYGVPANRIFRFPVEPDYALIETLPPEKVSEVRDRLGLRVGRRRVVFSGRLVPAKRPDLLVGAFNAVAGRRPEWDLVIVGDGPLRAELEARLGADPSGRVVWTGHLSDQAAVAAVYRASDVLVLPSDYEPWALVVNEAAAAGLAIVCSSAVGAAAELVRDGVNGALFPPGDLAVLTDRLLGVTAADRIDALKAASPAVLADWRRAADPVAGLGAALRAAGVYPPG